MGTALGLKLYSSALASVSVRSAATFARLSSLFVLARTMEAPAFAVVAYVYTWVEVLRFVADFGVDTLYLREVGRSTKERSLLTPTCQRLKILMSITAAMVGALVLGAAQPTSQYHLYTLLALPFSQLQLTLAINYYHSHSEGHYLVGPTFVAYGCFFLVLSAAFIFSFDAAVVFIALATIEIALAWLLLKLAKIEVLAIPREFSKSVQSSLRMLRAASPIGIGAALGILYTRWDVLLIERLVPSIQFREYVIAARLVDPFGLIAIGIISAMLADLVRRWNQNKQGFRDVIRQLAFRSAAIGLITAIAITLGGAVFLKYWLPTDFEQPILLGILAFALVPRLANNVLSTALIAVGRESWVPKIALVHAAIWVPLISILSSAFGTYGAAIGVLLCETISCGIQTTVLCIVLRPYSISAKL